MEPARYLFLILGGLILLFLGLFAITSVHEKKHRAALLSSIFLVAFGTAWLGAYFLLNPSPSLLVVLSGIVLLLGILFFLPMGKPRPLRIVEIEKKVDERDVIFAREEYFPGTEKYESYYALRPENKALDEKIRALPELLAPGGRYFDPIGSHHIRSVFKVIEGMLTRVDGETSQNRMDRDPVEMTRVLKGMVRRLGAEEVGIAVLNPMYVYSDVGRGPEEWGSEIRNNHKYAVVFTLEMDYFHVEEAPLLGITQETATQYLRGALISIALARHIRFLGYPARAHVAGSNYQIMLPPVAHDAGLGELGRLGYLISPRFGPRIRLGAITTDLPMIRDQPLRFGVQEFCESCKKCAINCPSGAIPHGDRVMIRGVEKWQLHIEKCLNYWRFIGTDCGLCMKVCPYSHPPTFVHNLVRAGIRSSPMARRIALWGDDLFYGKKLKVDR